jgi:hypothetical protein
MINPNLIFRKTDLGSAEVTGRKLGLRSELRRLLILIDGKSTVGRLATFVRDAEIETLLLELQALGVIDTADGTAAASVAPPAATATASPMSATPVDQGLAPTHEQFLAARTTAVRFVNDALGPSAETLAIKLERTRNPQELRDVVNQVKLSLERMMGAAVGQRFLDAVRSSVKLP